MRLKEDSSKQTKGRVAEAHMALPVDSWCYRIPEAVEAESSLDFRKVHERLQRVLRPRSKIKTMRLILEQDKNQLPRLHDSEAWVWNVLQALDDGLEPRYYRLSFSSSWKTDGAQ